MAKLLIHFDDSNSDLLQLLNSWPPRRRLTRLLRWFVRMKIWRVTNISWSRLTRRTSWSWLSWLWLIKWLALIWVISSWLRLSKTSWTLSMTTLLSPKILWWIWSSHWLSSRSFSSWISCKSWLIIIKYSSCHIWFLIWIYHWPHICIVVSRWFTSLTI